MERAEFGSKLKTHDWYYAYSDDHRVWRRGTEASGRLRAASEELNCPFDMGILKQWAHNMIVGQFAEEAPGEWYRQPRIYKSIAPVKFEDLITQAQHDEITNWMTLGATVEQIAKFA